MKGILDIMFCGILMLMWSWGPLRRAERSELHKGLLNDIYKMISGIFLN